MGRLRHLFFLAAALYLLLAAAPPTQAIPAYSRLYDMPCRTCHTVAPHLNASGLAFQANFFRWTAADGSAMPRKKGLLATPVSAIVEAYTVRNASLPATSPFRVQTVTLYASDNFVIDKRRNGGYFLHDMAAIREQRGGELEAAFAALPLLGSYGELAVTAGQFSPMMYQYDPMNSLIMMQQPRGLSLGTDGVAFTDPTPGIRLDYFDHRGRGTADGNYMTVGVSYRDHLAFNKESRLYGPRGVFLHGFRRQGKYSAGAFSYLNGGKHQYGLLGTAEVVPNLYLLASTATARDVFGPIVLNSRATSVEANWITTPQLAFTGRLESTSGLEKDTYPVAAITYYPFTLSVLRISAQSVQQKGNRQLGLYSYLQF